MTASVADDVVAPIKTKRGKELRFGEEHLEVVARRVVGGAKEPDKYAWTAIEKVSVNWYCFSGALTVKLKNGEEYKFPLKKKLLMLAASAIHRRIGKAKSGSAPDKPINAKLRNLLSDNSKVGVSDNGLMFKSKTGWWTAGIVSIPWNSLMSLRLSRSCYTGTITVGAIIKKTAVKRKPIHQSVGGGLRHAGQNLLSGSEDEDNRPFSDDKIVVSLPIKTAALVSEALYQALLERMCERFSDTEELPMAPTIGRKTVHTKLTKAGLVANLFHACSGESKAFIPWTSMISLSYKYPRCCKKACLTVQEVTRSPPIQIKLLEADEVKAIEDIFAKTAKEIPLVSSSLDGLSDVVEKGVVPTKEGVHYHHNCCCSRLARTFVPWARIDGLVMVRKGISSRVSLITEAGHEIEVAKKSKKNAWDLYDKLHDFKYGEGASGATNPIIFNENKDKNLSCVLTEQSLRLALNGGKCIKEIDLERVISARRGKNMHTQLEISVSMGTHSGYEILTVPIMEGGNARSLAKEIRTRVDTRKSILLKKAMI